jgi:spoIIIJ-associated protein
MLLKRILNFGGLAANMEFEDKNLKAVIKKAAKALKVPEETLKYEVISYGSTGIFGLVGAKKAKIRVLTKKAENEKPRKERIERAPRKENTPKKEAPKKEAFKKEDPKNRTEDKPSREKEKIPAAQMDPSEQDRDAVSFGKEVTQRIVNKITENATVRVEEESERVLYHVEGGKSAVLIGKRGQTLEAIQYIVDRIVNKKSENRIRIQIDVAGYLENKKTNLEQRACHLAEKVKKTGKPVSVGELNVYDRKIVHLCLKEDRNIRTQSMGSGFYRKLMIFPKKNTSNKNNKK